MTHYEETLARDIRRISEKVTEMGALAVDALEQCFKALSEKNRQLAYTVILRDRRIDELEEEIDRLCLEFIVRQQPVAGTLRFAYSTIKVNSELERVGDYAESIARHILLLTTLEVNIPSARIAEIAERAIPMVSDAVHAFVAQDEELARRTMAADAEVNRLRHELAKELLQMQRDGRIPVEALLPLMTVVNRFERVADQAKSICQDALYARNGEYVKHPGAEAVRLLFVDETNSCLGQMAEAIGNSLGQPRLVFTSAGMERAAVDARTVAFLKGKGIDISRAIPKSVVQVPHLDHYQVYIGLSPEARQAFPPSPNKAVCLEWKLDSPQAVQGSEDEIRAAYQRAYDYLHKQILDLANAIVGDNAN